MSNQLSMNVEDEISKVIDDTFRDVGLKKALDVLPGRIMKKLYELSRENVGSDRETQEGKQEQKKEKHVVLPRSVQNFVASQERRLARK
jgi:hypothetical protein